MHSKSHSGVRNNDQKLLHNSHESLGIDAAAFHVERAARSEHGQNTPHHARGQKWQANEDGDQDTTLFLGRLPQLAQADQGEEDNDEV